MPVMRLDFLSPEFGVPEFIPQADGTDGPLPLQRVISRPQRLVRVLRDTQFGV